MKEKERKRCKRKQEKKDEKQEERRKEKAEKMIKGEYIRRDGCKEEGTHAKERRRGRDDT